MCFERTDAPLVSHRERKLRFIPIFFQDQPVIERSVIVKRSSGTAVQEQYSPDRGAEQRSMEPTKLV
jgi:hypothetical protein